MPQRLSRDVLRERYLLPDETGEQDLFDRVARALASVEPVVSRAQWVRRYRRHLRAGGLPAGRILRAAGTELPATLINCFVQPLGHRLSGRDEAGRPGLQEALNEAVHTLSMGGGVGCDFSALWPMQAQRHACQEAAPDPCASVDAFERACAALERAGERRGAQMAVLRLDHPDVLAFITAKRTPGRWSHFNVSVAVPDAFMQALQQDVCWPLLHQAAPSAHLLRQGAHQQADGRWVYRSLPARALWDQLMRAVYDAAEPGVLFIDRIRQDNNLRELERIDATNPCGEQPLPAYGSCALAPLVLPRFVKHPFDWGGKARFSFAALRRHVGLQVRVLDNVLDLTRWPLPQQAQEAAAKRRIGVGFTGLGDALIMLGLRYDSPQGRAMARRIAHSLRDAAYAASVALARERGAFALFCPESYLAEGTFASRLPEALKQQVRTQGIRNSHLLCVAPTGTVSIALADNTSSGIEPAFTWTGLRRRRGPDGRTLEYPVEDHAFRLFKALGGDPQRLPPAFVTAQAVAPQGHLAMMRAVQPYIDASISKTVQVRADLPYADFRDLYLEAWRAGLKGLAAYRPSDIRGVVIRTAAPMSASGLLGLASNKQPRCSHAPG